MAKNRSHFICQNCGATYSKWAGKCDNCGEWNTLVEEIPQDDTVAKNAIARGMVSGKKLDIASIDSIRISDQDDRLDTGFSELDIVLGGGILSGSVSLLAGQPGIGKSTILMQICSNIANQNKKVLYVSGEESASQVKMRAVRLGAKSNTLSFASSTSGNDIAKTIEQNDFDLVIIDSIQTLSLAEISSAPGTVSQVSNCGNLIIRAAKATDTAVIIVGHVTKNGTLAGPKLATMEGNRPILVEIQALVNNTNFGYPKRTASGFDLNRLNLLIAVLEKRTRLKLQDKDVFINVVGGLKLKDNAADLAICMAIASAAAGRKLSDNLVVFGEVGLGGEIRSCIAPDRRIAEAKKIGFKNAIAPATIKDKFVFPVKDLRTALVKYMNNK